MQISDAEAVARRCRRYRPRPAVGAALVGGGGRPEQVADIMGKGEGSRKRDCSVDTEAMAGFARAVFDRTGWAERFDEQVREMNEGKVGRRCAYPDSLFTWAVVLRTVLGTSCRFTLGVVNSTFHLMPYPFSSFHRSRPTSSILTRCIHAKAPEVPKGYDPRIPARGAGGVKPSGDPIDVAVDSTGLSLKRCGGWLAGKRGLKGRSGWIKLHVAVNAATNEMLAYAITAEDCGDPTCLAPLMDAVLGAGHRVRRLLADAAYDSKEAWRTYSAMGIDASIDIRSQYLTGRGEPR